MTARPDDETIREQVRATYSAAALASAGTGHALGDQLYGGLTSDAGALASSLGCANPTALVDLQPGQTVLDLGSGGGLDVLLSARRVGPRGRVIGVDMTPEMIALAQQHAAEAGLTNVEFRLGTIEDLPVPDGSVDVVISNCVVNLSPDKNRVFAQVWRVLAPGGRLAIADLATLSPLPEGLRDGLGTWAACIAGALSVAQYQVALVAAGFVDVQVQVLRTFGLDDLHLLEGSPLGADLLADIPQEDLQAAQGALASVHVTATKAGSGHV